MGIEVPRRFELRSLDSESRVLTVTPQDQLHMTNSRNRMGPRSRKLATRSRKPEFSRPTLTCPLAGRGSAGQHGAPLLTTPCYPKKERGALTQYMSSPGVEPGLSRPQRDVLTTRR